MESNFYTSNYSSAPVELPYNLEKLEHLFDQIEIEGPSFDFRRLNDLFPQTHPDTLKILFLGCDELKTRNAMEKYEEMTEWIQKPVDQKKTLLLDWIFNEKNEITPSKLAATITTKFGKDSETTLILINVVPMGIKPIKKASFASILHNNEYLNRILGLKPRVSSRIDMNTIIPTSNTETKFRRELTQTKESLKMKETSIRSSRTMTEEQPYTSYSKVVI